MSQAAKVIDNLSKHMTITKLAKRMRVSRQAVYKWWRGEPIDLRNYKRLKKLEEKIVGDVIVMSGATSLDIPVDRVLDGAKDKLKRVLVLGVTHDNEEYFASSFARGEDIVWMLERMKLAILRGDYTECD